MRFDERFDDILLRDLMIYIVLLNIILDVVAGNFSS